MKIDWKRKLASRKFWAALIGFITSVMIALNVDALTAEQITAVIGGVATLVAYILAEGFTDAKSAGAPEGAPAQESATAEKSDEKAA